MPRLRQWPWLTFQVIAANVGIVLTLGYAWYWVFMRQSTVYSDRLMSTFDIEPGQLHTMFVADVERQLWASVLIGSVSAVLASVGLTLLIVRPLRALARTTDRLRLGDYSVRVRHRSGEVGKLADTLNALAAALEHEEHRRARYLADLGHELRTPITSLRGYTEGLEDGVFRADDAFFDLMSSELNHLTALTHSIEAMELETEDRNAARAGMAVAETLKDAESRWRALLQKSGLRLEVKVEESLLARRFALSEKSVRHIIDNLMSNMMRYADDGHPCQVDARRRNGDVIELAFRNAAAALPADAVPQLFDRFFRASESRTRVRQEHSSGLGLSIVKQLCLANGGMADASLKAGQLSVVVRLPLAQTGGDIDG